MSRLPAHVELAAFADERGQLTVADNFEDLPFTPVRLFTVTGVPEGVHRGGHAQRTGHELLICVAGSCTIHTETGAEQGTFVLNRPDRALYVPAMVWVSYHHATPTTALVVLCSSTFDPADYIDDHAQYLSELRSAR